MGLPRQEYWSELPFPSLGIFLTQDPTCISRIEGRLFTAEPLGKCFCSLALAKLLFSGLFLPAPVPPPHLLGIPGCCSHLFFCPPGPRQSCDFNPVTVNSSVAQSCPTLCNPMNRSTPGLPVHHQLPEFTQTHVHRVGDAIHLIIPNKFQLYLSICLPLCFVAQ